MIDRFKKKKVKCLLVLFNYKLKLVRLFYF